MTNSTGYLYKDFKLCIQSKDHLQAKVLLEKMVSLSYPKTLVKLAEASYLNTFKPETQSQKSQAGLASGERIQDISSIEAKELHHFGMTLLGPAIGLFYRRLAARTSLSEAPTTLYFLAREGYLLQRGFNSLREELGAKADARYLVISRTLMFRILLSEPSSYPLIFSHSYKGTLRRFLGSRCGLLDEELVALNLSDAAFPQGLDTQVSLESDESSLSSLLQSNNEKIQTFTKGTKDTYLEYLHDIGLMDQEHIQLVDIGYSGTIQKALGILTSRRVSGHYMVTTQSAESNASHTFIGYLFNRQQWGQGCSVLEHSLYLEALLTSPTGSAKNIKKGATGFEFTYGPTTESQDYFHLLEIIFQGAIYYCANSMAHHFSLTPADVNELYSLVISNKECFPELSKKIMVVEDNYSGLGNIKPTDLYAN
jgi:hypothetical protein